MVNHEAAAPVAAVGVAGPQPVEQRAVSLCPPLSLLTCRIFREKHCTVGMRGMGSETRGVTNMGKSQRGRQRALCRRWQWRQECTKGLVTEPPRLLWLEHTDEYWMRQGKVSLYKEDEREVGGGC